MAGPFDQRNSGTLADPVELLPDSAAKPTSAPLSPPPSFGEVFTAARTASTVDRSDFETQYLTEGYRPILEALGIDPDQNPGGYTDVTNARIGPILRHSDIYDASTGSPFARMASRSDQEQAIAARIRAARAKDPKAFPGIPDTVAGIRAYLLEQYKAKRAKAMETTGRAEGFSGGLANFLGSATELLTDPVNIATLPIGGGGRTVVQVVARETLVNGVIELANQPIVAMNRAEIGEELTLGEAAANVTIAGVAGGILEGGIHVAAKAAKPLIVPMKGKVREALIAMELRGLKVPTEGENVRIDQFFTQMTNTELAGVIREITDVDKLTPDERAALNVIERAGEVGEASPFHPSPEGDAEHEGGLAAAIKAIENNRQPTEGGVMPPKVGTGEGSPNPPTPARPPAEASTAAERSRVESSRSSSPVRGEAAIAAFKAKTRSAESGGKDNAQNPRSSARGRYQFTDDTFRRYYKRIYGVDLGEHPPQSYKDNPELQERLMDALTRDNAAALERIGETVNEGNLYLAHFAGSGGASKILKADPGTPIERILSPAAIEANPFLRGKSASEVIAWAHGKMGAKTASIPSRGGIDGGLDAPGEDARIAQLRDEAMKLSDQIVGEERGGSGLPTMYARSFAPDELTVDAARFQFKSGGDDAGVTERLRGVTEWNPIYAGRVVAWEDSSGRVFIADGHQRHGLASRIKAETGADVRMDAIVLREADGVTAADARVYAALKNIAEGTGTPIDAAKVVRDAGPDVLKQLPPKSMLVRDGAALARLSDEAFGAVYNEIVPADLAAVIGHLLPDRPEAHAAMIDLLVKLEPANRGQAESLIRQALAAGLHKEEQIDLFGSSSTVTSLFLERAKVLERGLAKLRKMRLVHKTAAKEADALEATGSKIAREKSEKEAQANAEAVEIISRLAFSRGPVADALNAAAARLAGGAKLGDVVDEFAAAIRELDLGALSREAGADDGARVAPDGAGRGGDTGEAGEDVRAQPEDQEQPSLLELERATERFSDPDGPAVKQQAESLIHDARAEMVWERPENLADLEERVLFEGGEGSYARAAIEVGQLPDGRFSAGYNYDYGFGRTGQQVGRNAFPTREAAEAWATGKIHNALLDATPSSDPGKYADQDSALEELQTWSDGQQRDAWEIDRNSHHAVALAGLLDGGDRGSIGEYEWRLESDDNGPFIRVWNVRRGEQADIVADPAFLLTRGLEQATSGKLDPDLDVELEKIAEGVAAMLEGENAAARAVEAPSEAVLHGPTSRREKILAASKALEGVQPGELRAVQPFPDEEPGYHRFRYVAEDGTAVGGNYTIDDGPPPFVEGFNVGDTNNPQKLGAREVRKMFDELRRLHPEATRIHAYRMTGARAASGDGPKEIWIDLTGKGDGVQPETVDVHVGEPAPNARDDLMRFASGMSRRGDLTAGTYALADSDKLGVGVEIGELSAAGIEQIARAVVDWRTNVFVDSGAFPAFRRNLRKGTSDQVDFEKVLAKYDEIQDAIADYNAAESADVGRVLFVMPDVVGDQAASLALLAKYKDRIRVEVAAANAGNLAVPIIPLQKGELSIGEAFEQAAEILETREFKVGVPSNEAALSTDEFAAFLEQARPSSIHFLGAASEKTLGPKIDALNAVMKADPSYRPSVTADANLLRSKLYGRTDKEFPDRQTAVLETLRREDLELGSKSALELEELRADAAPTLDRGAEVDPGVSERQRLEMELRGKSPLRPGAIDAEGTGGLGLFDAVDEPTFRLTDDGEERTASDLLKELDDDDAALATLKGCL